MGHYCRSQYTQRDIPAHSVYKESNLAYYCHTEISSVSNSIECARTESNLCFLLGARLTGWESWKTRHPLPYAIGWNQSWGCWKAKSGEPPGINAPIMTSLRKWRGCVTCYTPQTVHQNRNRSGLTSFEIRTFGKAEQLFTRLST